VIEICTRRLFQKCAIKAIFRGCGDVRTLALLGLAIIILGNPGRGAPDENGSAKLEISAHPAVETRLGSLIEVERDFKEGFEAFSVPTNVK
jgi:hypothetical protein